MVGVIGYHRKCPFPPTAKTRLLRSDWLIVQQISREFPARSLARPAGGEACSRCSGPAFEDQERSPAVIFVAIVITVGEVCPDFPQVACLDRLIARRTERMPAWRPLIHQYKSHVAPPSAKQNTVSAG
jgi:hypothetical protein